MIKCRLKVIFAEKGIVQRQFAKELGMDASNLSLLVQNRTKPRLDLAMAISEKLNIPIDQIWIKENGE